MNNFFLKKELKINYYYYEFNLSTLKKASQTILRGSRFRAMKRKAIFGLTTKRCRNDASETSREYCVSINAKLDRKNAAKSAVKTFLFHLSCDFCCTVFRFIALVLFPLFCFSQCLTSTPPPFLLTFSCFHT